MPHVPGLPQTQLHQGGPSDAPRPGGGGESRAVLKSTGDMQGYRVSAEWWHDVRNADDKPIGGGLP